MNNEMVIGSRVRFSTDFYSHLMTRQMRGGIRHAAGDLDEMMRNGMTVQGFPREGRVNVKFDLQGAERYRTYSARDLAVMPKNS